MAFSLVSQRTGLRQTFTIRDILDFWGNVVDDEVFIGEDVFNLSTYREEGGTGGNAGTPFQPFYKNLSGLQVVIPQSEHKIPNPVALHAYVSATGERVALGYIIDPTTKTITITTNSFMQGLRACIF